MSNMPRRKTIIERKNPARHLPKSFVAIDFETADYASDSACAIGLVKVVNGEIVKSFSRLIRPPRDRIVFSYLHGITWPKVQSEPSFRELWPSLVEDLNEAEYLVAHSAGFDQKVLHTCCSIAGLAIPMLRFECTVKLARSTWNLRPTKLPDVCRFLNIPLNHHDPHSDAEACAKIVLAAMKHAEAV
jgi:DNA polymerase-3 subunit epsilon